MNFKFIIKFEINLLNFIKSVMFIYYKYVPEVKCLNLNRSACDKLKHQSRAIIGR